jgi:iron complex transport system ATP-binding protein
MMKQGDIHSCGTPQEVLTYDRIEQVYNTVVVTQTNPLSGKPAVFLISENILNDIKARYGKIKR